jgi:hypothetical protein
MAKSLDLSHGRYMIGLSSNGYKLYEEWITIEPGRTLEVNVLLAKVGSEGDSKSIKTYVEVYITVRSEPSGADVYLDDELVGKTSIMDYRIQPGDPNDRKLKIVKPGYETHEETIEWIDIESEIRIHISAKLKPLEQIAIAKAPVKERKSKNFTVNSQVIVLSIVLLAIIAVLATRVAIRRRQRNRGD